MANGGFSATVLALNISKQFDYFCWCVLPSGELTDSPLIRVFSQNSQMKSFRYFFFLILGQIAATKEYVVLVKKCNL